ncbi:hypothetical protein M231_02917 [Tremella mesenterica]|uniref:Uncharacterized protein n=1 Tax=Tremella mesenterica TaxID=5217 RepID=A0A4Q1BPA8_TREME|nr:hypothetical protein M231_02917 [Tremella mesenterica]
MAAPQAYCFVNAPLLLQSVTAPNTNHPHQLTFGSSIDFIDSDTHHPVVVYFWTMNAPVVDEVVAFWGSLAHDGTTQAPLTVFATSVERFQWADLDADNYMSLVPEGRRPMIIAQGTVQGNTVNRMFVLKGQVYGNHEYHTFIFKVWVPNTPRWIKVPLPNNNQIVAIRGELDRCTESGMFVVNLHDMALPARQTGATPPTTPGSGPSPKRVRRSGRHNPVQVMEEGPDIMAPQDNGKGGPSGSAVA